MPQTNPYNAFSLGLNPYVLAAGDPGILQEVYRDSSHALVTEPRAGTQARGQHAPASIFKMLYGRQTETVHAALRSAEDRESERKFISGPLRELLPSSPHFFLHCLLTFVRTQVKILLCAPSPWNVL